MRRFLSACFCVAALALFFGCDEAKQAAKEVLDDQKHKVKNKALESARKAGDEARENIVGDASAKLRGEDGAKKDEETEE